MGKRKKSLLFNTLGELYDAARYWRIWTHLGWGDVLRQYRRSFLGPVWLTINSVIFVAAFGFIGSRLFNVPIKEYMLYLSLGQIIFNYFSMSMNDACLAFVQADGYIKNFRLPLSIYVLRVMHRSAINFMHSLPVLLVVVLWFGNVRQINYGWLVLGIVFALLLVYFCSSVLALISARFRDLPMLVTSAMQILIFVSPVMWKASQLGGKAEALLYMNPVAVILDVTRTPIMGGVPQLPALTACCLMLLVSALLYITIYIPLRSRVAYWV